MDLLEAIRGRYSCRAFQKEEVDREIVEELLAAARWAPSGANCQPWELALVKGEKLEKIKKVLARAVKGGELPRQDFDYYPENWKEPYRSRRYQCGLALYGALNIDRKDDRGRKHQWEENYRFFGAPLGVFLFVDRSLGQGALIDCGMFLQNFMLACRHFGLESCAQASLGYYPDLIKKVLRIGEEKKLLCGLSLGYADKLHGVNHFRTDRVPPGDFARWYE